jgi:aminomethyltransferase
LARALLAQPEVRPIGLGARNSLRLEAGLCLYGNDIDATTTPVEAGLTWAIQQVRRRGGARAGGFPGADKVLAQLAGDEKPERLRVGLVAQDKTPVREPAPLADAAGNAIGHVTSGLPSPTLGQPIAMGYVAAAHAAIGTAVFAQVRGRAVPLRVTAMPFVPARYYRG